MPHIPDGLFESVVALNRLLLEAESLDTTVSRVAEIAVSTVEGADLCGVTMLDDRGKPTTAAFTDPDAPEIDSAQYVSSTGPCLDAYRTQTIVRWNAEVNDSKWPEFARAAKERGVRSSLSLPLMAPVSAATGALNLYARSDDAFPDHAEPHAQRFAEQVALACATALLIWKTRTLTEHLERAIQSRDVIGQAKGIIMATTDCTADEAFSLLTSQSQHENRKLHEIAEELIATRCRAARAFR